ncbi:TB2/DP1/HVA22-related protein [Corchorus olitorius]|uniref:TB2/DP1/HVA22-related protein n=1 Tax=Corchorus olitorius TaxID=93759 RepID=A0A1R3I947_9ROSI|nr:TB2/DP1/HVA22-related protein [Corchorus olitorius]
MGSEAPAPLVEKTNTAVETSVGRTCATKTKGKGKIPKRINKAEREKLKRERLNEHFLDLANALDPNLQNNGKASILCEATRLLKDLFGQIESLRKENASLLSESHYVNIEKNELKEENSTLETQIKKLRSEIGTRVAPSKPDLNEPLPGIQQSQLPSHFHRDHPGLPTAEPALQQPSALLVVPIHTDIQPYPVPDSTQPAAKPNSIVSKPHARYPTAADSWPSQLLGKHPAVSNEFRLDDNCRTEDRSPSNFYASVRAIESASRADDRQWLTYWVLYSMITLVELTFAKVIEWLPFWSYAKLIFTCWLVIPYFSGAAYVYEHYLRPLFLNPQQTINIWYVPRKKDFFSQPDDVLTAAEKYMEQNGKEAFENLIHRADRSRTSGFIYDDDGYRH